MESLKMEVEKIKIKDFLIEDLMKKEFAEKVKELDMKVVSLILVAQRDKQIIPLILAHQNPKEIEEKIVHIECANEGLLKRFEKILETLHLSGEQNER